MTTDEVGGTSNTWSSKNAHYYSFRVEAITASASGILQTIGVNVVNGQSAGNIRVAIYSSYSSPNFSGLLGQSSNTAAIDGWNDLAIPGGINIAASATYYIVFTAPDSQLYCINSGTDYYGAIADGATFPDPLGATSQVGENINMRMTYAAASATGMMFGNP